MMSSFDHFTSSPNDGLQQYLPKRKSETTAFESLSNLSLRIVIEHFNQFCSEASLYPELFLKILQVLPVETVDHRIGAEFIHCESFYKTASTKIYGNGTCVVDSHGQSWKRLYFEKIIVELLEKRTTNVWSTDELLQIVRDMYLSMISNL